MKQFQPVVLVIYDASKDVAYWLHVQDYFARQSGFKPKAGNHTVTVRIPKTQVLNPAGVRHIAMIRDHLDAQIRMRIFPE